MRLEAARRRAASRPLGTAGGADAGILRALRGLLAVPALLLAQATCAADCDTRVFTNQEGFYAHGAKRAVIATAATQPLAWRLVDGAGETVARGETRVYGDDALSGEHVQLADFSDVEATGAGFRIVAGCAESHPFRIGHQPYGRLAWDALRYFYHSRSGVPIEAPFAGGELWARPAGHVRDVATCRTDRDPDGNRWPGCDYELDATGGWYDAGDHGKYVVNGGIAVWTLLNYHERQQRFGRGEPFADGSMRIPESNNGVNDLLDEARVELEFLLAMQAPEGATAQVPVGVQESRPRLRFTRIDASGMAHHKIADEEWTPLPKAPHRDEQKRVLFPVSTAATLNLAATAAQCARIWRDIDAAFADRCLAAARRAWEAAERNPDVWFIASFSGSGMYGDRDLSDEFFWAAAELYVTTGEAGYREALGASPFEGGLEREPAWPRTAPLGIVSLVLSEDRLAPELRRELEQRLVDAASRFSDERREAGFYVPYATPRYTWGSNSNVLNRALILALAYDLTGEREYRDAVIDAMDYLLGRNPLDRSYVSGYGERPFTHPHHRFWAPSFGERFPPPPPGVLSGGPNIASPAEEVARKLVASGCAPQTCWADDVRAYSLNEVAINWNAPLVWVAAFLDDTAE